ncbi:MAG TPA: DMT family transporter [Candidatus Methylacidiphilales bacterium]
MRTFLLLPLCGGIVYAVGTLLVKRAAAHGVGPWRTAFACNSAVFLFTLPFLFGAGGVSTLPWGAWWQPALTALAFFVGQLFTFYAIEKGDLSVATPVLGTKVVFVAFFTVLLIGIAVPLRVWLAACLTASALAIMGGGGYASRRKFLLTVLWAGLAAFHFAIADVLVQKWAPHWGGARFSGVLFLFNFLLSLGLIPFFHAPLRSLDRATARLLFYGSAVLGFQGMLLYYAISRFGHAASNNVVYNFRALATIVLVWCVGHWFRNTEREAGRGVMVRRLVGSALLLLSIALVMR